MIGLGDLPGGSFFSNALGVSLDGSIVVGLSDSNLGDEAFIYTDLIGMRTLSSVLSDFGASLPSDISSLAAAMDIGVSNNVVSVVGAASRAGSEGVFEPYLAQLPIVSAELADQLLNLTPGLTSDTLVFDVSATRLLYGDVGRYEFDFTTDGIYDLVLDVGTPLFNSYWDDLSESFLFPESDVRSFYSDINAGGFGSLTFNTTIRMTHENGTAINTDTASITVVPEVSSLLFAGITSLAIGALAVTRRRRTKSNQVIE